jgi:hypothetical protein
MTHKGKEKKRKEKKGKKKKRKKIVRMRSKEEHVAELEKTEYRSRPINIQNKQKGILVLFGKTRVKKASEKVRKSPGHIAIVVAILTEEGQAGGRAMMQSSRARATERKSKEQKQKAHTRDERDEFRACAEARTEPCEHLWSWFRACAVHSPNLAIGL